jgi:hypothetical protein
MAKTMADPSMIAAPGSTGQFSLVFHKTQR